MPADEFERGGKKQPGRAIPILVTSYSGRVLEQIGITHQLISQQTGGAFYLFIAEFGPESGNRLHVHTFEDETVYVLQGVLQARLADDVLEANMGATVYLPKGIPHALYNPTITPLRLLALATPGGMEAFFDELEAALEGGRLDDAMHRTISRKYGIDWLNEGPEGGNTRAHRLAGLFEQTRSNCSQFLKSN